jgi:hypothetical protein
MGNRKEGNRKSVMHRLAYYTVCPKIHRLNKHLSKYGSPKEQ